MSSHAAFILLNSSTDSMLYFSPKAYFLYGMDIKFLIKVALGFTTHILVLVSLLSKI
jgi:hypothetical protein